MKRIIALIILAATAFSLVACGGGGEISSPVRSFPIQVRDQSGIPVINAELEIFEGTRLIASAATDAKGIARVELYPGEYTVNIKSLPEGYEAVENGMRIRFINPSSTTLIRVQNNTADGSANNPYKVKDTVEFKVKTSLGVYLQAEPKEKNTLVIYGSDKLVASVGGKSYAMNRDGRIVIELTEKTVVYLRNDGPECEARAELVHPFGSAENPHAARLDTTYQTSVTGRKIYYSYTAEADIQLTLKGLSEGGAYTVKNLTTGEELSGEGITDIAFTVTAGEEYLFIISGTGDVSYMFDSPARA